MVRTIPLFAFSLKINKRLILKQVALDVDGSNVSLWPYVLPS